MADRPEFSESTKRKLAVRWDTVRDNQKLTEEDLSRHDLERRRLLGIAAKPPRGVNPLRPKEAARSLGLDPSVRAAVARFRGTDSEYWRHWCFSGTPYQTYAAWLDSLKQETAAELASFWNGRSDVTDRWFQETCAPAIEKALAVLVKQRIAQAREVESKRLEETPSGNPILNEILAGGHNLSPQAQRAIQLAQERQVVLEQPSKPLATKSSVAIREPSRRRGYRAEVRKWMTDKDVKTVPDAASRLGVGHDTLKSIMSDRGEKRYSDITLAAVLKKIAGTNA